MTLYLQNSFSLPANTAKISQALFDYRIGKIDRFEYIRLTGTPPPEEVNKP